LTLTNFDVLVIPFAHPRATVPALGLLVYFLMSN